MSLGSIRAHPPKADCARRTLQIPSLDTALILFGAHFIRLRPRRDLNPQ